MKKTERINLVMDKKELEAIKDKAKELGLNLSAYIRLKALEKI